MNKKISHTLFLIMSSVVLTGIVLSFAPKAQAQGRCTRFEAIIQGSLPSPLSFVTEHDTWGGPIYASLGGKRLVGNLSGHESGFGHGTIGMATDTLYKVCFGDCTDSFTYEANNAVWPTQPGKVGVGSYQASSALIVSGTGKFQFAEGTLHVAGPFIVWMDEGVHGRWNGSLSGTICGVQ